MLRKHKFLMDRLSLERMYISFVQPLVRNGNVVLHNKCTKENKCIIEYIYSELLCTVGDCSNSYRRNKAL